MWAEISQPQSFDEYLSPFAHNNSKFEGVFNEFPLSGRKYFMHNYYRSGVVIFLRWPTRVSPH